MKAANRDPRPTNRNVTHYRFPLTAIVSILHRVSGVVLFLAMPYLLYLLSHSLASAESFVAIQALLQEPLVKCVIWVILAALSFHWVAGVRHVVMDIGFAESLGAAQIGAVITMIGSGVLMVLAGVWLW